MEKKKERLNRGEDGFTLVELLVVVAILSVLVAVVMTNFSGLLGGSQTSAAAAELNIVQTAVDVKMADQSLSTVTAVTSATSSMSTLGISSYVRTTTAKGTYTLAADGTVTQVTTGY